jgi:N-acetylglutamate synthase-like GNAT family acetyltransferase
MIRKCLAASELQTIYSIVNDAAVVYKGVIPDDRWHEPYMPLEELQTEISRGVNFWGYRHNGVLIGVMGIQDVKDVTLIRHAYVKTGMQKRGIGTKLLNHLKKLTNRPLLIGTWKAAVWAVEFYRENGFTPVTDKEKNALLKKYWTIPDRQIETSVVLADERWLSNNRKEQNG